MLELALALLAAAAAAGAGLAVKHLRAGQSGALPPLWAGAGHGLLGLAGLALALAAVLGGGPPAGGPGTRGFLPAGLLLLGLAALLGMLIQSLRVRGRRPHGLVLGVHATLAVFGLVLLLAHAVA